MSLDRLPNVPIIHLPRIQISFIKNHKSYLIDALNISSRIPVVHHHHRMKRILPKKHQPNPSISSSLLPTNIKIQIDTPSHTRFGKSMLALYFQKYRFISPIDNNKKDEFLRLLKAFRSKQNICLNT